jgi:hypothetical protein
MAGSASRRVWSGGFAMPRSRSRSGLTGGLSPRMPQCSLLYV